MKTVVINLKDREDRLKLFRSCNPKIDFEVVPAVDGKQVSYIKILELGIAVNHDRIDPLLNTTKTKGEVGCFLSHWRIWEKCIARNEKVLVLEDDARLTDDFNFEEIDQLSDTYDFLYLGWKEMEESLPLSGKLVQPVYPLSLIHI